MSKLIKLSPLHQAVVLNSKAIVMFAGPKAMAIILPNLLNNEQRFPGQAYLPGYFMPGFQDSAHDGGIKAFFNRFCAVNCGQANENAVKQILHRG